MQNTHQKSIKGISGFTLILTAVVAATVYRTPVHANTFRASTPASPQSSATSHSFSIAAKHIVHLKPGHTYRLTQEQMASVIGAGVAYHPGDIVTDTAQYGSTLENHGNTTWYILEDDGTVASNAETNGWKLNFNHTTKVMSVGIPVDAYPGSILAFAKTGTIRIKTPDGYEPDDVGYEIGFEVD